MRPTALTLFLMLGGPCLLPGCAGLPAGAPGEAASPAGPTPLADAPPVARAHSVQFGSSAAGEAENGDYGARFVHDRRRDFPDQGWWCSEFDEWLSPQRAENGYTIILPGIEGTSCRNISIARGLVDAGHAAAIEVRDWTTGYWPLWPYHLMALERNRRQAQEIAAQIVEYQDHYPGRPVTMIGHSGGAAMAILTLEALPADCQITQVVLLAGAISQDYDLTAALAHVERDIINFHSWGDVAYLILGTLALGTIDRRHAISAGASGFQFPDGLTGDGRELYAARLHQVPYRLAMLRSLNTGGHFSPTGRKFVAEWVAPRLAARDD